MEILKYLQKTNITTLLNCLCLILLNNFAESVDTDGYKICTGKHTMPLGEGSGNIETTYYNDTIWWRDFETIPATTTMETNGGTLFITMNFTQSIPTISSGPFGSSTYRFQCVYFEWLNKSRPEYDYENLTFPVELHLVFYKIEYEDIYQALGKQGALAILAFGLKINPESNTFDGIVDYLTKVRVEYSKSSLPNESQLPLYDYTAPDLKEFFTYNGSSTHYYCAPSDVMWLDFIEPIGVSPKFVQEMQQLYSYDLKPLMSKIKKSLLPTGPVNRWVPVPDRPMGAPPSIHLFNTDGPTIQLFTNSTATMTLSSKLAFVMILIVILCI